MFYSHIKSFYKTFFTKAKYKTKAMSVEMLYLMSLGVICTTVDDDHIIQIAGSV